MDIEIIKEVVNWLKDFRDDQVHFTFHGGEPLLAGFDFYREALPLLREGLGDREAGFSLQTNLWYLTDELAQILRDYDVAVSSSLDGPRKINEVQRGEGYFEKTMNGYKVAQAHDLKVNFICTFTSYSKDYVDDIFNYFLQKGYNLKLHPCLTSLRDDNTEKWALSPEEHGKLLVDLLDKYLENLNKIEIRDFDHMCKSYFIRRGTVCIFADCMGDTFAVGYDGDIYPCYRFIGMSEYVMGNVRDHPTMTDLSQSTSWKILQEFKEYVDQNCAKCPYLKFCRGGCPYNALAANKGKINSVDPHCTAYKMIFKEIGRRATKEMLSPSNIQTTNQSDSKKQASKPGILSLMLKGLDPMRWL